MARRCSEKKMFLKISQNSENACTSSVYQSLLLIKLQACNFIKKETLTRCFPGNCAKFLRTPFLTEHLWWLLLSKMWLTLQFSIFLLSFFIEDFVFISFQQENEIKKGKYPDGVQIFTFFSSIDLCDFKDFKRNLANDNLIRKRVFKENLMLQFSWFEEFRFLGGEHLTGSSKKTAQTINFKLCTRISNRLLHKTVTAFFSNNELFLFYSINSTSFESVFCMKTVIQKIFKRKKIASLFLFVSWLATYQWKKIIENCNSVCAGADKVGKTVLIFGPTLTVISLIFGERKNGKSYILKTVGLSTIKEILKKLYIIALSCF